jgi:hypothetical protein
MSTATLNEKPPDVVTGRVLTKLRPGDDAIVGTVVGLDDFWAVEVLGTEGFSDRAVEP